MCLTVKSLNGDTAFLLTFTPSLNRDSSTSYTIHPFTVLVDPWLAGPAEVFNRKFATVIQTTTPCISSLCELEQIPSAIIISQDQPDHCNKRTLCQLPSGTCIPIFAAPGASKKIEKWKHFAPSSVIEMRKYNPLDPRTIYRLAIPPSTPEGTAGELTIAFITEKWDISAVHTAIGITYRSPLEAISSMPTAPIPTLPTPPDSPMAPATLASKQNGPPASPIFVLQNLEDKPISIIYSPHGVRHANIQTYTSSHLAAEGALPITALLHSFDRVDNPWYMGGNIARGAAGGVNITKNIPCRTWIAAHDADKEKSGVAVLLNKIKKTHPEDVRFALEQSTLHIDKAMVPELVNLGPGEEFQIYG
jgi:hypothetical protein